MNSVFRRGKLSAFMVLSVITVVMAEWEPGFVLANWFECDWLKSAEENRIIALSGNYLFALSAVEQDEFRASTTMLTQLPQGICQCGDLLLVANGAGGINVLQLIEGEGPTVTGSFLDGFEHFRIASIDDCSFISANETGAVRRYRLSEGQPAFAMQLPDCHGTVRDLEVTQDTLRVLTEAALITIPLHDTTGAGQLDLSIQWQHLQYHNGSVALMDNEQVAVIDAACGTVLLETSCQLATFLGDTLWFFTPEGALHYAAGSVDSWQVLDSGFDFGTTVPEQMIAGEYSLLVTVDTGELWRISADANPIAELLWQGGGLIRQIDLSDHRLLISELAARRLLHLQNENSTSQIELSPQGLCHLTPTGLMTVTADSLRWDCRQHNYGLNGGGFVLPVNVCDALSYEDGFALLWSDRLRLYTSAGAVVEELLLNNEYLTNLRCCGETLLAMGGDRAHLIRQNNMGNMVVAGEWQLEQLRVAVYSGEMMFFLNPEGIWVAAVDEEARLVLPLPAARTLAVQGCRLAAGMEDGTVQLLRYLPGSNDCQPEECLQGVGRVEQIIFRGNELAVLRSSGLVIYRQEQFTTEYEASLPQCFSNRQTASKRYLQIEMSMVNSCVVAGAPVQLELGNRPLSAISLYNIRGQLLRTFQLHNSTGRVDLPLPPLSAGIYFLHAVMDGESGVVRFALIR
jgi:hypothetical protein